MGNGAFPDWITPVVWKLRACKMYGCTPTQLEREDYHTVVEHMEIENAEAWYQRENAKSRRLGK